MRVQKLIGETTEYRLVLVLRESRKILAINNADGYRLPSISILQWTRPAEQLREAIQATWKLHVLILDFFHGSPLCAVAEILVLGPPTYLVAASLDQLQVSELSEYQREQVASLLADSHVSSPFNRVGWIDEAIAWLESETGRKLCSKRDIEQYNAGGSFALLRFDTEDGRKYWLKATGKQNAHELSITTFLSKLCGNYLPRFVSSKPEWNAWLMSGDATCVKVVPTTPCELFTLLEDAVECMARLQIKTLGYNVDLISAGAFDQSIEVFRNHSEALFDYLEEAMGLQTSTKVPRLTRSRMQEMRTIFDDVCSYMEALDLPETIVHGDINRGNILIGCGHCQFIDWAEAYVGNPLICLQHLLLLNKVEDPELQTFSNRALRDKYRTIWLESCDADALDQGFAYMPLIAVVSTLYGRGDWLTSERRNDPQRQSYTRSLTRHMDRIAREPELLGALCH